MGGGLTVYIYIYTHEFLASWACFTLYKSGVFRDEWDAVLVA